MRVSVPTYDLYGEDSEQKPDFWLHCETLFSRSSLYHFEIGLHRHESFFQLLYIESGTGNAVLNGVDYALQTPCAIFVPPGIDHGFAFSKDISGHIITVLNSQMPLSQRVSGGAIAQWLMVPQYVSLEAVPCDERDYLGQTVRRINEEFIARRPYRNSLLEAYLTSLLTLIARLSLSDQLGGAHNGLANDRRLEQVLELVDRSFREHRPVSFYADALNLSPAHLNRIIRNLTGLTMQQLITRKLIDSAKRELVAMPLSVQNISYGLGFSDPAYFSRLFLRETGQTPRGFRLAEREKLGEASEPEA